IVANEKSDNSRDKNYKVLIVDDDQLVVDSFDRMLLEQEQPFSIEKALNGNQAIRMIERNTYDLVITDLVMPEVDGIQVLRKVKKLQPETEVILITAYSSYNSALDAIHFGAFDYIPKPVNTSEFKLRVDRAISKRKTVLEKNEKIQEMERLCYTIAHDFKATLLSIKGFIDILLGEHSDKLNEEGSFLLSRISHNVEAMDSMVGGLLEYTKIGKLTKDFTTIVTQEIVSELAADYKPALDEKHITFSIETHLPDVYFYQEGVRTVFSNLIDNAIKYARKNAESYIKVGVSEWAVPPDEHHPHGSYQFYVEDNGTGIGPENLRLIFEIFQREKNPEQEKGYGLGLAIIKKILETANSHIYAESEKNKKTVFYFTLPKPAGA
ncbi:MAG: response regulator, partial [Spirochaetota bacterium]